jgi:hypothetical protein
VITARRPVTHHVRSGTSVDAKGNRVPAYVDTPRKVYGWGPPTPREVESAGTTTESVDTALYAPTFPVDPSDAFTLAGERFEVVGSSDADHGPSPRPAPGMVVLLTRSS